MWTNGFTPLGNHSAFLPAATEITFASTTGNFWFFPFLKYQTYHWAARGWDTRWECDDYPNNGDFSTRHNIFVRVRSLQPSAVPSGQPSFLPSSLPSANPSTAVCGGIFSSCLAAFESGCTKSRVYTLLNPTTSATFSAYCDQENEGGGWMLFFSYNHIGGQNNALVLGTLPTSPTSTGPAGYSHINLQDLGYTTAHIDQVRFYCQTDNHERRMHFSTSNSFQKGVSITGSLLGK